MVEAGAVMGRDLPLEVCPIRYGASRDRDRDAVWLEFSASYEHTIVDVTVTSSVRKNSDVRVYGGLLPLHCILAQGAQQVERDVDIRSPSCLGTPSIYFVHDYYPSPLRMGVD
jgi:hypothetical protein